MINIKKKKKFQNVKKIVIRFIIELTKYNSFDF